MKHFLLTFFAFLVSLPALADYATYAAAQNWQVADEVDSVLQTPVCRAFTNVTDSAEPVELSLSFPKDGKTLPMMRIQTKLNASLVFAQMSPQSSEVFFLLRAASSADTQNIYWYAPVNFTKLEKFIRDMSQLQLVVEPKGSALSVKVSLSGSMNALGRVDECLGQTKRPTAFWALLNQQKDNLTPDLGQRTPIELLQATDDAYQAYLKGLEVSAALDVLKKPVAGLLKKEASAKQVLNDSQSALTKAQTAVDAAQSQIANLPGQIADQTSQLTSLKQNKPILEADLRQKQTDYQTLKPQMAPYEKAMKEATAKMSVAQKALADMQDQIVNKQKQIVDAAAEKAKLEQNLPALESKAASAKAAMDTAWRRYNNFDQYAEKARILREDPFYQDKLNRLKDATRAMNEARRTYDQEQDDYWEAQRNYDNCRRDPEASCSLEEMWLNSARWDYERAKSSYDSAASYYDGVASDIERAERIADLQASMKRDSLLKDAQGAESNYDAASARFSNAKKRIASIPQQIAKLQGEIATAQAALPGLQQKLSEALAQQASAQASYDQFAKQIGFDVADQNFKQATEALNANTKGIADLSKSIPTLQAQLKKAQKDLPTLQKNLTAAQSQLGKAQGTLAGIQQQLAAYYQQAAPLEQEQANQDNAFKTNRAKYQDLYELLVQQ